MPRTSIIALVSLFALAACNSQTAPEPVATQSLDPLTGQPVDTSAAMPMATGAMSGTATTGAMQGSGANGTAKSSPGATDSPSNRP